VSAVVILLLVGAAAVAVYLYANPSKTSSTTRTSTASTSSSSGAPLFRVDYDNLTVGYNSGLWQISLTDIGGQKIKLLTATLSTPVETKLCTGALGGFFFGNCAPTTYPDAGFFPTNATFKGFATGAGPGSAKLGTAYTVTLNVVFADGTTRQDVLTIKATSG